MARGVEKRTKTQSSRLRVAGQHADAAKSAGAAQSAGSAKAATKQPRSHKGIIVSVGLALCMVFAFWQMYPVLRDYYIASREHERLLAEYAAVLERNERVALQISNLKTPEGIEDRAREQFGWTKEGEQAVNITGLSISDSSTALPAAVSTSSIVAEASWWTDFLDMVFNVQPPEPEPDYDDPFFN
jgi:cell division protein FtsB